MASKILYCATVDYHFKAFHLPMMKWFKEQGWQVDVIASGDIHLPYTDNKYNIPIQRSPFSRLNVSAYQRIKQIIDQNDYDIVHCHTPLGGVLARLATRKARKKRTKTIYTAHGFHFCKGSSWINWLIYYPIEKYLARHTDSLITINQEDLQLAQRHRFKANRIEYVPGVGVDTKKFEPVSKSDQTTLKKSLGYQSDDFLLFYAAEFNKNKNQQFLIHMLAQIKEDAPQVKLLLAGEGIMLETCRSVAISLGVAHMVDFLGFRKDVAQILQASDLAVAASFREGLPVNVMEAMSCGLPVIASKNRGHLELIDPDHNGYILSDWDPVKFALKVKQLANNKDLRVRLGINGRTTILEKFSIENVLLEQSQIYQTYMEAGDTLWAIH